MPIGIVNKLAGESRLLSWDFAAELAEGEALTGAPTFVVVDGSTGEVSTGLTVGTPAVSGARVQALVSGGVAGMLYFVTCTALTDAGQTLQVRGGITVG